MPWEYIDSPSTSFLSFPEYALGTFAYKTLSMESVIADKINGIFKRKKPINILKDAFDLWFLVRVKGFSTTPQHVEHIFQITRTKFDLNILKERLKKAKEAEKVFAQYLPPERSIDLDKVLKEAGEIVRGEYENLHLRRA